jgi:hypothetical protein
MSSLPYRKYSTRWSEVNTPLLEKQFPINP